MEKAELKLRKKIMRRIYLYYLRSLTMMVVFWQGMFLGISALLLAKWLHVASIIKNFLSVPVGDAPKYVYGSLVGAVGHGEVLTVLVFLLATVTAISVGYQLVHAWSFVQRRWYRV